MLYKKKRQITFVLITCNRLIYNSRAALVSFTYLNLRHCVTFLQLSYTSLCSGRLEEGTNYQLIESKFFYTERLIVPNAPRVENSCQYDDRLKFARRNVQTIFLRALLHTILYRNRR